MERGSTPSFSSLLFIIEILVSRNLRHSFLKLGPPHHRTLRPGRCNTAISTTIAATHAQQLIQRGRRLADEHHPGYQTA